MKLATAQWHDMESFYTEFYQNRPINVQIAGIDAFVSLSLR